MKNCGNFFIKSILFLTSISLSSISFAEQIKLYEEPKTDSKVVGTFDLSTRVIPIYTPNTGDWIKIADPNNGNLGWVKISDLKSAKGNSTGTYTQKIIRNGQGGSNSYFNEFGQAPAPMTKKRNHKMAHRLHLQKQKIQQSTQRAMQEMVDDISNFSKYHSEWMTMFANLPFIMPNFVAPTNEQTNSPECVSAPED